MKCPECKEERVKKIGVDPVSTDRRFKCKECGHKFSVRKLTAEELRNMKEGGARSMAEFSSFMSSFTDSQRYTG